MKENSSKVKLMDKESSHESMVVHMKEIEKKEISMGKAHSKPLKEINFQEIFC